jgi:type IV pilus assembly protein PilO
MPELGETRRKVKIAIAVLVVLDVAAAGILFSPLVGSANSRNQQLSMLGTEIKLKTRQVEPLRGLDKKIPVARHQIDEFYKDRLTSEDSEISGELQKLASASGVKINGVKYAQNQAEQSDRLNDLEQRAETVGLHRVLVEADLSGDYLQLMRFINALERNKLFFIVDSVVLGGEQGGSVKLEVRLETYSKVGIA